MHTELTEGKKRTMSLPSEREFECNNNNNRSSSKLTVFRILLLDDSEVSLSVQVIFPKRCIFSFKVRIAFEAQIFYSVSKVIDGSQI